ncbi:MAG: COX15/CtaA family protein [Bacteroidota bacterium]
MSPSVRRFVAFAWVLLIYTGFVILWGAFVRATGSGAGCGDHWPLCNGEVIPRAETMATLVEFGHRLTSGLAGFLALGLGVWAFRVFPRGSKVRKAAAWTVILMGTEALVGMALVKLELVAYNVSVLRGWVIAAHLLNTFLLLTAITLTAWWAGGGHAPRFRGSGALGATLAATVAGVFILGASGAVTALGDTLTIGGGIDPASDPVVAALVGLRIYHPLLALVVGVGVLATFLLVRRTGRRKAYFLSLGILSLYFTQLMIGVLNVRLMAPVPLQLVHLLMTDVIWVGLILLCCTALGDTVTPRRRTVAYAA